MFDFSQMKKFCVGNKEVMEVYLHGVMVWEKPVGA